MPVGDRQHRHLHRREPQRERAGVVLDEDGEEPLDRAEQRAVDHDRPVPLVVGADVLDVEALRHLEVELDRRHLPRAADRVARLHRDLRAVERAAALVHHEVEVLARRRDAQRLGRLVPLLVGADRLALGLGRQLEVEVVEAVVAQQVEHEVEQRPRARSTICSFVQKMCASSWVMPRTRVRPCTTPDFS